MSQIPDEIIRRIVRDNEDIDLHLILAAYCFAELGIDHSKADERLYDVSSRVLDELNAQRGIYVVINDKGEIQRGTVTGQALAQRAAAKKRMYALLWRAVGLDNPLRLVKSLFELRLELSDEQLRDLIVRRFPETSLSSGQLQAIVKSAKATIFGDQ